MAKAKIVREAAEASAEFSRKAYNEILDFFGYGADAEEIMSEAGKLSPQTRNLLKALERDDFLGFETPDQALKQFIENPVYTLENYDVSPQLKGALTKFANNPPSKPAKNIDDVNPRIGAAAGGTLLGMLGLAGSQDTEAAVVNPKKVIQMINAGVLDPTSELTQKVYDNAVKRMDDLMNTPYYRDAYRTGQSTYTPDNVQHNIIQPESMMDGAIVNYRTDRSDKGKVSEFLGSPVDVDVQSGYKFTPSIGSENDLGWMSMGLADKAGTAQKAHNKAIDLASMLDAPVYANSAVMGVPSSRFSTPVSELMMGKIRDMDLPKELVDAFDAEMRKTDPDWVGLKSDSALDQLIGRNGFSKEGAGAHRHRFLATLEKAAFRDAGLPQPRTALSLIDSPEFAGLDSVRDYGLSGVNIWTPDVDRPTSLFEQLHNSYNYGMPKTAGVEGRFEAPISFKAMNPDIYDEFADVTVGGKPSKRGGTTPVMPIPNDQLINASMDRKAGGVGTIQRTNQRWLDSVSAAIEHNKNLIAQYGSLGAALAAGQTFADVPDPVEELRQSEQEFGMSDIEKLRASEREFMAPNSVSDAYGRASQYWDTQRQDAANSGATLAEWFMPDYEYSQKKAMGDKSIGTGIFAALEKLDPMGYVGLIDALRNR